MKDVPEEEQRSYSSVTKEKIGKSMLSQLNQQLLDFKPSDLSSNEERKSHGGPNYSPAFDASGGPSDLVKRLNRDSKSSTEYQAHNSSMISVPKGAMMPKPVKEAIQTNDSLAFSKIVNNVAKKKKS